MNRFNVMLSLCFTGNTDHAQGRWGWSKRGEIHGNLHYTGDVGKYHLFKSNPLAEAVQPEDKTEELFPSRTGTID